MLRRFGFLPALLGLAAILGAATAGAQTPAPVVIRAQVTDTARAPMANVAVAIIYGRDSVMLVGITNTAGRFTFTFATDSALHRITARAIGYVATTRLVRAAPGDTLDVALTLARVPAMLDTVRVAARTLSDDYYISAAMIANLKRPTYDIHDVILDLRPNMLYNDVHLCGPTQNIWVNGVREQRDITAGYPVPPTDRVSVDLKGNVTHPAPHVSPHYIDPESVLAKIRPQDVADVKYVDCWHDLLPGSGARNALFITLKPGYIYVRGRGSMSEDSLPAPPTP